METIVEQEEDKDVESRDVSGDNEITSRDVGDSHGIGEDKDTRALVRYIFCSSHHVCFFW